MAGHGNDELKNGGGVEFRVFQKYFNDMIKIIPITTLSGQLVSANIITPSEDEEVLSPVTPTEKAKTFLLKVSRSLEAGYTKSFYGLLDVLENFGNQDCIELSRNIRKALPVEKNQGKSCVDKLTIEDFCKCKTPRKAFRKLSSRMLDFLSYANFNKIRRVCIEDANSPDGIELPSHIVDAISCTNNINELFDTLAKSHYWNWIDVRMLEVMVDVAEIPEAEQTLDDYKKFVSPFKIKQILPDLQFDVVSKNYTTIQEKFNSSDEETLTVGDILEHQFYLAYEICDINPQSMKLRSIKTGCLELVLAIPKESTLHAYKSALKNVHKFDKIHSLVVGNHSMICPPGYSPLDVVAGEHTLIATRKRRLGSYDDEKNNSLKYFKPSTVADEFSSVVDKITHLLQSYDPRLLVEQCESIMGSDLHNIKFFSTDQLNQLKEYANTPLLLQELSHLWSWSNHSVLRELVRSCDEAVKLLDEFDCHLDPLEPITSYPASETFPKNPNTHTTLELKCDWNDIHKFSLQTVINLGSLVVNKCDLTQHCPQLLKAAQGSIMLYWSIPKCVSHLVSNKVLQHCRYFCENGVIEVVIQPHVQICTSEIGDNDDTKIMKQLQHVRRQYESILNEYNKLKQDESKMFTILQTQEQRCKELEEKCNKMQGGAESKTKERIAGQQSRFRELKVALDKVIKTLNKDAELPIKSEMADEGIVKVTTTVVENWQQLEYETEDLQKLIDQLQHHATKSVDESMEQQKQHEEDINELTKRLSIKDEEIAKLKVDNIPKQLQRVRRQCDSLLSENNKLKEDERKLLAVIQTQEQRCKELDEKCNKIEKDVERETKERIVDQQSKFKKLKVTLDKVIKTLNQDAKLPFKSEMADEGIVKVTTTVMENWQQLEYETDDIQKLIDQLQHHAIEAKAVEKQQQKQHEEECNGLTIKLSIKEKEIAKLKEDNRLLLKSRSTSKESKQLEVKVDKDIDPIQFKLLGIGNYGEVHQVQYKDKLYAGKVFNNKLLPGYPNVSMNKLVGQFKLKCYPASKFSHPNVEQFVEITESKDSVLMIITELLNENLTAYISRTHETFHYDLQLTVCSEMAQGLQYLHSQQLVHSNLHGANVLITHDHHAKIADYLCPLLLPAVTSDNSSVYFPPETVKDKRVTVQSNVFTLALLFLQVVTKHSPQPSKDLSLSELERRHSDLLKVPKCHPLLDNIQQCLNNDEVTRPLMREVCDNVAKLLEGKDSAQMVTFKLIHTTQYPRLLPALATGRHQLKHVPCQNLPVPMYWAYAVTIGMMVYVTGGNSRNGDAVEHVHRFDLEKNHWDKLPPSKYHHCVPVVLEGKLSLIGGRKPNKAVISKVNTYVEESNEWKTVYPDMNQPRYRPAIVTTDSHVIVLGGKIKERSKLTDTIEIMNIKDKEWMTLATTLPDKMYDMSATISNDKVWIIGYDTGSSRSNKVFTVSMNDLINLINEKHSWEQLRNDTVCFKTAVVSYLDVPVILGGDDRQNKTVSAVVAYDPKTESWSEVAELSSPRALCAAIKLPGERGILVIGGCTDTKNLNQCNSSCLSTTEIYYVAN